MGRLSVISAAILVTWASAAATQAAPPKPRVGISLPLTGIVARMGEATRRGFELYQAKHPGELEKVEVIFDDHRYDGKQTLSSFHHLVQLKKVDFIVSWGNTPSEIVAPIAETQRVPSLLLTHQVVARDRKYVVAMGNRLAEAVEVLADFFRKGNFKRPASVSVNLGNALEAIQLLKKKLNGNLIDISIEPEITSFQPLILRMKQDSVDGLLLFALAEQAMTFGRQAATLQFSPEIIGGDIFADQDFLSKAKPLFGNLKFVYGHVRPWFIEDYSQKYGDISYFFEAAMGYTLAALIYERIPQVPRPRTWTEVISGADLGGLPLVGLRFVQTKDDGARLQCDSIVYSSEQLPVSN